MTGVGTHWVFILNYIFYDKSFLYFYLRIILLPISLYIYIFLLLCIHKKIFFTIVGVYFLLKYIIFLVITESSGR